MSKTAIRIRERRQQLGLSQFALAQAIDKSLTQVTRYERGDNDPTGEVLIALAKVLETTTDYLLGLVDEPEGVIKESDLTPEERELLRSFRRDDIRKAMRILLRESDKSARERVDRPVPADG
jgi:transcriptional regulator with XRE-family HTH domain